MSSLQDILKASGAEVLDTSGRKIDASIVQQKIDTNQQISMITKELEELSDDEKVEWISMRRLIGNKYYKAKNFEKAKNFYFETITAASIVKDDSTKVIVMCNMSMCLLALQQFSAAKTMADKAIEIQPDNLLVYEKRARIFLAMNQIDKAEEDVRKGMELANGCKKDLQKFQDIQEKIRSENAKKKEMYKKMMKRSQPPPLYLPSWLSTFTKSALSFLSIFSSLKNVCRRKSKFL